MVPRSVEELARLGVSVFDFVTAGAAVLLLFMACYFFTFKKTSSPTEDAVDYLKINLKLSNASARRELGYSRGGERCRLVGASPSALVALVEFISLFLSRHSR